MADMFPFLRDELVENVPDILEEGSTLVWVGPDNKRYLVGVSLFELGRGDVD